MCDYSLHAVPNRLAREGEELVTHRFPTSSMGLASPADLEKTTAKAGAGSWWTALTTWLTAPPAKNDKVPAVCIPPGARLRISGVPLDLQNELGIGAQEEVYFVQFSASAYRYRDGFRFRNGREILLQYLEEGLRVEVLTLALAEPGEAHHENVHEPEWEEDVGIHLR